MLEDRHNARSVSPEAISQTLVRLRDVLNEENGVLESKSAASHESFIARKNQILRELMMYQRGDSGILEIPGIREELQKVRELVDRNYDLLRAHVDAMTEITSMLTDVAIAEEADGTYDRMG
ncbi:MAG: hypothetical protein LCH46_06730 [Proteobacteria bacterium]|nr:hypothetical protein [Pseudomonadota bacterium]